ncbi:MAG: GC-type dockerin domain-anchored protein, partial [Phycisphaerales bacterium]
WTINDPLGTPSVERVIVGGMDFAGGPSQDAPNLNGGDISTLDGRLMNVQVRNGQIYTGHAIDGDPGITVARWYHMDLNGWPNSGNNPTLVQQGEISGNGSQHYFFPAIYSDKFDNVGLIMSRSSSSEYASVQVAGRTPSDPAGTMSTPIQLAIGDTGTSGRWGDYLDIAMDPNDDTTFWIVGMYAKNFGWQTWIDSFTIASPCPADLTGDGQLNFFDISAFLSAFNAQDPVADINGDGVYNFFDVSGYITLFNQGCP